MTLPKQIIVVSDFANVNGGAAKVAIDSSIGLVRRGVDVCFFSAVGPPAPELDAGGVQVHCLNQLDMLNDGNPPRAALRGLWNQTASRALERILRQCDPASTIVHFHLWVKALSPSVFRPARRLRFPFVITFHDYFTSCPNGAFLNYPKSELCSYSPMSTSCMISNCDARGYSHKLWRLLRHGIQDRIVGIPRHLKHGIYLSHTNKSVLVPHLPKSMNWHHVSNPIDVGRKGPRAMAEQNERYYFVGRLAREKGADVFLKAIRQIGAKAVVIGDGQERNALKAINPEAEFVGWVPVGDLESHLRRARALVFPSIWYEGQPLVVLMAKSLGIPVVASSQCAATEMVSDGATGLHFRRSSVTDLSAKLSQLADNATIKRMSKAAHHDYWSAPSDIESHLDQLMQAYERIMNGVTPSRADANSEA